MRSLLYHACILAQFSTSVRAASAKDVCENTADHALRYSSCAVPDRVILPATATLLEEQLQATALSHEGKFLSFEEWKARNFEEQAAAQDSGMTTQMSTGASSTISPSSTTTEQVVLASTSEAVKLNETGEPRVLKAQDHLSAEQDYQVLAKKERFNHASFDCAASIVQSNKESKGPSNILKENKDYYMLNTCAAANKFVIIELCNDILVDSIQLANYEFFSGIFKDVKVLVASKYPPGREGWQELGQFRARHTREVQTFEVDNPLIWTRYVRIEMLSFYGNEFYCPLSLVRVFGKTMMEDYKQEGVTDTEAVSEVGLPQVQDPASQEMLENIERAAEGLVAISDQLADDMQKNERPFQMPASVVSVEVIEPSTSATSDTIPTSTLTLDVQTPSATILEQPICRVSSAALPLAYPLEYKANSSIITSTMPESTALTRAPHTEPISAPLSSHTPQSNSSEIGSGDGRNTRSSSHPSTQESIYKQMAKRISLLEANATLSLRYIESQSSLLAQSFSHLSSQQARHLANFLENVNVTMLQRIAHLKQEYEQLYMDAAKSIKSSRHRQELDMNLLTRKIGTLSDDITFFKRLGMFQLALMLVLISFLVTSRHAGIDVTDSLHRALSRQSPLHSPVLRVGSPMSWRHHLRGQSSFEPASIYSFPVEQIDRPDRATLDTHHAQEHVYDEKRYQQVPQEQVHESKTGLGINLRPADDLKAMQGQSDIVEQQSSDLHKPPDEMSYSQDVEWQQSEPTHAVNHDIEEPRLKESIYREDLTSPADDYPTPAPDEHDS